jgi:hypothetical protein
MRKLSLPICILLALIMAAAPFAGCRRAEEPSPAVITEPPEAAAPSESPALTTEAPTEAPTEEPTEAPTEAPTDEPTEPPRAPATAKPTKTPKPTATPTPKPTKTPKPTATPTPKPTKTPKPTATPTPKPTKTPKPTATPTPKPTKTPKPTATPTPKPTNTPKPTATPTPKPTQDPTVFPTPDPALPYFLYFEKGSATLTVFKVGNDGLYSRTVCAIRCAYNQQKTPVGDFTLSSRESWHKFRVKDKTTGEYRDAYALYAIRYASGVYLHGPLYWSQDHNDLIPDYYDGDHAIGGSNTGGCLRMVVRSIRFICEHCPDGTMIRIVNGSPLGTYSQDIPPRNGLLHDPTDVDAAEYP